MLRGKIAFSVLLCWQLLACSNETTSIDRIELIRSPHFIEMDYEQDRLEIAQFLENYLNLMFDSSQSYRNSFWQSNILYTRFDRFLKVGRAKSYLIEHPPQLLGIRKDDNDIFHAKVAFFREQFPEEIIDLTLAKDAAGQFYFIEGIGERVKAFTQRKNEGLEFYYSPTCQIDSLSEKQVIDYNRQLAQYFESAERKLRVIVCKDLRDYAQLMGADYATYLNIDRQSGGRALPDEDLYISANGSPFYPHELVHIYTANFNPHPFMDEGMATYLGGSGGIALKDHLKVVIQRMNEYDFSSLPEDFYLYENYQASYIIGGLLLKLADQKYGGKDSVLKLLSTGRDDQDLQKAFQEVFGFKQAEMDSFIKEELLVLEEQED